MSIENTDKFGNYLIHGIDEVVVPDVIAWWPSAPGWRVLGVIVLLLLIVKTIVWAKRWWRNRYRREALRQLDQLQQKAGAEPGTVLPFLPYYIKVTALQTYPRADVASLSGKKWLLFLDAHCPGSYFTGAPGNKLLSVAYLPQHRWNLDNNESEELIQLARFWIARHQEAVHV